MNSKYIFQHVDLNSIQFVNNKNDVEFVFHNNSEESDEYCGSLTCINILSLHMETYFSDGEDRNFPQYVLDVYPESQAGQDSASKKIWLVGNGYSTCVICKEIEVCKV